MEDQNHLPWAEVKWELLSHVQLFVTPWLYSPRNSPGQNTGVGSLTLLQGIFPTQGLNPGLPHCRQILYQLSHKGSPKILEWVDYPFSSGSSQPRNQSRVSCIAGGFFTNWAIREAHHTLLAISIILLAISVILCESSPLYCPSNFPAVIIIVTSWLQGVIYHPTSITWAHCPW